MAYSINKRFASLCLTNLNSLSIFYVGPIKKRAHVQCNDNGLQHKRFIFRYRINLNLLSMPGNFEKKKKIMLILDPLRRTHCNDVLLGHSKILKTFGI